MYATKGAISSQADDHGVSARVNPMCATAHTADSERTRTSSHWRLAKVDETPLGTPSQLIVRPATKNNFSFGRQHAAYVMVVAALVVCVAHPGVASFNNNKDGGGGGGTPPLPVISVYWCSRFCVFCRPNKLLLSSLCFLPAYTGEVELVPLVELVMKGGIRW